MAYRYGTFTGYESQTFDAETGQSLTLNYDLVIEKGSLEIEVQNPAGDAIWQKTFEADAQDSQEIALEQAGRYTVIITAGQSGGGFELAWEIK